MALDTNSNARFYDLYRYRKMCKVSANVRREDVSTSTAPGKSFLTGKEHQFRLLPSPCLEMGEEQMVVVVATGIPGKLKIEEGEEQPPPVPAKGEDASKPVPPENEELIIERAKAA